MKNKLKLIALTTILSLSSLLSMGQSGLVSGVVVDSEGISLPGVSVVVKGTTNGTISSIDGRYALVNVQDSDTIQFSFVGYVTQNRKVDNQSVINVILEENSELLEDVQVVAFQKQKKESVIGSINTIKPGELKQPTSNLTASLAGKMSGVIAYQRSGEPGADNAEFFVRGVTSFGYKNNPLILIDGLEVSSEDLARMEPDNIASFSIMKDATATSLYGARGANGVILVTTKEGRKGKATVSIRYENAISSPTQTNQFLEAVDYMELYNSAQRTRNPNSLLLYSKQKIEGTRNQLHPEIYPDVNWYNELFNTTALNTKTNMNISGGGEVATYYLSIAYTNEKGLLKVDPVNNFNNNIDINRYELRANINLNLTKTTKAAVKFSSMFNRYNGPAENASDIFEMVMDANPANFPKYFSKDENTQYLNHTLFGNKGAGGYPNPYAEMVKGYKDKFSSTILAQFQLEQDLKFITEGLKFRGMASVRTFSENENTRSFTPFYYGLAEVENETGIDHFLYQIQEGTEYLNEPTIGSYSNSNFYFELVGQYNRNFARRHDVGALLVWYQSEFLNTKYENTYSTLPSRNIGLSGRVTYAYDSRYFTELNFGYNGSEKFAEDNRFGFFPSAGLGWIISNEPFWGSLSEKIHLLKLKYTYGLVGNDAISDPKDRFFYLSDVNINDGSRGYSFGYDYNNSHSGYIINRYPNPEITWEVAKKSNYGLELGLFNTFTLQADYFEEYRSNIYMAREYIPETMGLTSDISSNIGEAKSHGIDASLDINHAFSGDFWVTARGNFTYATNEVIKNGEPNYQYDYLSRIGHPINQEWGYVAQRLFVDNTEVLNSPEQFNQGQAGGDLNYLAGDIKYVDVNEDGKIDQLDMVPIGHPTIPEIVYGFGASMGFKNFDFSFFFQGIARESFFIETDKVAPFIDEKNALEVIAEDHWSDDNPDPYAFWPRLSTFTIPNNDHQSTWWIRNGSFIRLKSIELGYSLPRRVVKKAHMDKVRFYFSGINLLTFSKFKLWDPEMAGNGLRYPPQKVYNFGVQITF